MLSARRRRRAAHLACIVVLSTVTLATLATSRLALAADPPKPGAESESGRGRAASEATTAAHQHAARAHDLYQQGAYHEAITELETALQFDPNGKDLVFNLGVVHEKLGDIDDALRYFQRYEQMDLAPQERSKADTYLKRLQGARKEVEKPAEPAPAPAPAPAPLPPPPPPPEKHYGRFDWVTATVAVVGVGGLAVGSVFGVKALSNRPATGVATTDTYGYAQVLNSETVAHRDAIVSDVTFAIGGAGVLAATVLFFARTRDSASPSVGRAGSAGPVDAPVVVSFTPLAGGGALFLGARF